jgi:DNA (cytosine-5)-methyltransferase 1
MLRLEDDPRNHLYLNFRRIVEEKQPLYFLAENVRGILSLADGSAIRKIEADFTAAGYRVAKRLFNVADYGVPQGRQRVIIAGTRNDAPENESYVFPEPTHCSPKNVQKTGLQSWVSIGQALEDVPEPEDDHELLNHVFSSYKVTNRNFTGHRPTDPDKPSPTILARGDGKGGVCAIHHPRNHRRMSVREQAIVQTFPLDFEFAGKMNSCYRQVGNAVPVLFGKHLGEQLRHPARIKEVV